MKGKLKWKRRSSSNSAIIVTPNPNSRYVQKDVVLPNGTHRTVVVEANPSPIREMTNANIKHGICKGIVSDTLPLPDTSTTVPKAMSFQETHTFSKESSTAAVLDREPLLINNDGLTVKSKNIKMDQQRFETAVVHDANKNAKAIGSTASLQQQQSTMHSAEALEENAKAKEMILEVESKDSEDLFDGSNGCEALENNEISKQEVLHTLSNAVECMVLEQQCGIKVPNVPKALHPFASNSSLSLSKYVERICYYVQHEWQNHSIHDSTFAPEDVSVRVLILGLIYLDRLSTKFKSKMEGRAIFHPKTIHLLLFIAIMTAVQYTEDGQRKGKVWARVGGVSSERLLQLSQAFCSLCDYDFNVHEEEYFHWHSKFQMYATSIAKLEAKT